MLRFLNRSIGRLKAIPGCLDIDEMVLNAIAQQSGNFEMCLDLGSGPKPWNPSGCRRSWGIDLRDFDTPEIRQADLVRDCIPFNDAELDVVTAYDFIEHIPRLVYADGVRFPFVNLMSEIYRVLRSGGVFVSVTPVYPFSEAFRDPTHVNIISYDTFEFYFCGENPLSEMYGFVGRFDCLSQHVQPPYLITMLVKR